MSRQQTIRSFEGARGIAALIVAIYHFGIAREFPLIGYGYLFVDLFFVLSGLLVCSIYVDKLDTANKVASFLIRRFGRLFPLLTATAIGYVLVDNGVILLKNQAVSFGLTEFKNSISSKPYSLPGIGEIAAILTMTHALGIFERVVANPVSWSISAEFYTYVIFSGICLLVSDRHNRAKVFIVIAMIGYALTIWASVSHDECIVAGKCMDVTYDLGFARCVLGFFAGGATWLLSKFLAEPSRQILALLQVAAVICLVLIFSFIDSAPWVAFVCPFAFALLLLGLSRDTGVIAAVLGRPFFQLLGERSYSIYMIHSIILLLIVPAQVKLAGTMYSWALLLLYLITIISIAEITYRRIEVPWRDYFNKVADRTRQPDEILKDKRSIDRSDHTLL